MPENIPERLNRLRDRIKASDDLADRDRELLLTFDDRLALHQYSGQRQEKLLRHCTIAGEEIGGLADALEDREAAEEIVRWIHDEYTNEETNRDYRVALRMFGKRVAERLDDIATDDDDIPKSLAWIGSSTSRNYDPAPDPAKMLDWEDDVVPMVDATLNARDSALIAVAWDTGVRAGELLDLRVGDVTDHDYGLQITVDGKVGQRSVTLITAVPYLNRWLQDHPRRDDDTAPLWCKLQNGEEMSYQMARKIPREAAKRADVSKPVTFTNFRKSSASHLVSHGVNQAVLEDHHGWQTGSDVAARYVSVFADASDRAIARAHGLDVEADEPEPTAAITCPRCERKTPREESVCMWCQQAIEHGAADELDELQQSERQKLLGLAKEHPELIVRLEEMEPLVQALGGDPDVIDTARQFVDIAEE